MGVTVKPCTCDADKLSQSEREEKQVIEASAQKVGNQWMISMEEGPAGLARQQGPSCETPGVNRTPIINESRASRSVQR